MELNLSNTVQLITIIGFTAGLVKYLIVSLLQTAIAALNEAVKELKTMSLMDTLSLLSFFLFAICSIYLLLKDISWSHYDRFSDMTIGSGGLLKATKYISNTAAGIFSRKKEEEMK